MQSQGADSSAAGGGSEMVTFVKLFCWAVSDHRVIKVALVYSGQW